MDEVKDSEVLEEFFNEVLLLPQEATQWLLDLWDAIQFLDDVADKDEISRDRLNAAMNKLLVQMPANNFYNTYPTQLLNAICVAICKWQASDMLERFNRQDERTYMWRAGYYDIVLSVTILCNGMHNAIQHAPDILCLYGESYQSYLKELSNA